MKLNIDYSRTEEQVKQMGNIALTQDYIQYAIGQKYPQMEGQKLRIYGRIQRKLDKAVAESIDDMEFEAAEIDMIKDSFKDLKAAAGLAKYITILMDVVDNLGKEAQPTA